MPRLCLERILHSQGFGTRRACRQRILAGCVTVGGDTCTSPVAEFDTCGLEFCVDGDPWRFRERAYVALNKPTGYECSHRPAHYPSVFRLLPEPLVRRGVQCLGRLDADTSGLLLFSDDGQFIHSLASPRRKVHKVYQVVTDEPVDDAQIAALIGGVALRDEPTPVRAVACEQLQARSLRLTIAEGKYHQVRRMIAAVGNHVAALQRSAIGAFALPADLEAGQWMWLEEPALAILRQ